MTEDSHLYWTERNHRWRDDFRPGFIVTTWAIAFACTAVLFGLIMLLTSTVMNLVGPDQENLPVIFAVFATLFSFFGVLVWRLRTIEDGRFMNGIGVGVFHTLVMLVLLGIGLALAAASIDLSDVSFRNNNTLGMFLTALERSAAVAVIAGILANTVIPERGSVPKGTQIESLDPEHSL